MACCPMGGGDGLFPQSAAKWEEKAVVKLINCFFYDDFTLHLQCCTLVIYCGSVHKLRYVKLVKPQPYVPE